jgi:hypothetical protein
MKKACRGRRCGRLLKMTHGREEVTDDRSQLFGRR